MLDRLHHQAEIRLSEELKIGIKIRKNRGQIGFGDSEPACQCRTQLLGGRRRNERAARSRIIRPSEAQVRKCSVNASAQHRPAEQELMITPAMVTAGSAGLERASEVG